MKRVRKRNNDFWGGLNMKPKMRIYALAVCLVLVLPVLAATYSFTSINPFSSLETSGRGINDKGDVVGNWTVDPLEPPDPGGVATAKYNSSSRVQSRAICGAKGSSGKLVFQVLSTRMPMESTIAALSWERTPTRLSAVGMETIMGLYGTKTDTTSFLIPPVPPPISMGLTTKVTWWA